MAKKTDETPVDGNGLKILPLALERGMPPSNNNGLYALGAKLANSPAGTTVTAIVTFGLVDIDHQELAGTRRPRIKHLHIEPIEDENAIVEVVALRDEAYTARTGKDQLDFTKAEDGVE